MTTGIKDNVIQLLPNWTVSGGGVTTNIKKPGSLHDALAKQDLIPDQLAMDVSKSKQWVHQVNWFVSNTFELPIIAGRNWTVSLDGVASELTLAVNGKKIVQVGAENAGRRLDVTKYLRSGENVIVLRLHSLRDESEMLMPNVRLVSAPEQNLAG